MLGSEGDGGTTWQSLPIRPAHWYGVRMATMNISLPEPMKRWIEAQTAGGRYGNASDFVRDLVRREQERRDKIAAMQVLIDEARASGISTETMADIRARVLASRAARGE